jgi:hypothetical protein
VSETRDKAPIEARMLSGKPFTYMELCKTHSKDNDVVWRVKT